MVAKKKHILTTEISHDYTLIVIKSILEDYRLAYLLNEIFGIFLKKEDFQIHFDNKQGEFSVFGFEDINNNQDWWLIANKQIIEKKVVSSNYNLFNEISNTYILIPEEKQVDYFFKIENNNLPITTIIKKLNTIHKVMTSYEIDPNDLKSKDLLIF